MNLRNEKKIVIEQKTGHRENNERRENKKLENFSYLQNTRPDLQIDSYIEKCSTNNQNLILLTQLRITGNNWCGNWFNVSWSQNVKKII